MEPGSQISISSQIPYCNRIPHQFNKEINAKRSLAAKYQFPIEILINSINIFMQEEPGSQISICNHVPYQFNEGINVKRAWQPNIDFQSNSSLIPKDIHAKGAWQQNRNLQ